MLVPVYAAMRRLSPPRQLSPGAPSLALERQNRDGNQEKPDRKIMFLAVHVSCSCTTFSEAYPADMIVSPRNRPAASRGPRKLTITLYWYPLPPRRRNCPSQTSESRYLYTPTRMGMPACAWGVQVLSCPHLMRSGRSSTRRCPPYRRWSSDRRRRNGTIVISASNRLRIPFVVPGLHAIANAHLVVGVSSEHITDGGVGIGRMS